MAFPRLALKNLHQKRAAVSSFADALLQRPRWGAEPLRRLSGQSSDGNPKDKEVAVNEGQDPNMLPERRHGKKWVWRNNGGLGSSLMQAAESINRVLKSLSLGGRVKEQEECYKLRLEMPGMAKEDVKVTVEGRVVRVRGEHKEEEEEEKEEEGGGWVAAASYGYYNTSVMLPEDAEVEGIKAELKDGVLTITIPRGERPQKDVKEVTVL